MKTLLFSLIVLFSFGCSAPAKPEFKRLENVTFNSIILVKPYSVTLEGSAVFYNPNVLGANITELDLDVYLNGKKATHLRQDIEAKMAGQSEFVLPVKCKIPLQDAFKNIKLKDLYSLKILDYKLDGHLKLGLGTVEFKIPVTYEGQESMLK